MPQAAEHGWPPAVKVQVTPAFERSLVTVALSTTGGSADSWVVNLFTMLTLMGARIVKLKTYAAPLSAADVAVMVAVLLRGGTAGGVYITLNFVLVAACVSLPQPGEHEVFA